MMFSRAWQHGRYEKREDKQFVVDGFKGSLLEKQEERVKT